MFCRISTRTIKLRRFRHHCITHPVVHCRYQTPTVGALGRGRWHRHQASSMANSCPRSSSSSWRLVHEFYGKNQHTSSSLSEIQIHSKLGIFVIAPLLSARAESIVAWILSITSPSRQSTIKNIKRPLSKSCLHLLQGKIQSESDTGIRWVTTSPGWAIRTGIAALQINQGQGIKSRDAQTGADISTCRPITSGHGKLRSDVCTRDAFGDTSQQSLSPMSI